MEVVIKQIQINDQNITFNLLTRMPIVDFNEWYSWEDFKVISSFPYEVFVEICHWKNQMLDSEEYTALSLKDERYLTSDSIEGVLLQDSNNNLYISFFSYQHSIYRLHKELWEEKLKFRALLLNEDQVNMSKLGEILQGSYQEGFWVSNKYVPKPFNAKEQFLSLIVEWLYSEDNEAGTGFYEGCDTTALEIPDIQLLENRVWERKRAYSYNSEDLTNLMADIQLIKNETLEEYLGLKLLKKHLSDLCRKINLYHETLLSEVEESLFILDKELSRRASEVMNISRLTFIC